MCYLNPLEAFTNEFMKRILIIVVLLLNYSCHSPIIEDNAIETFDNTYLLNDSPAFQEYLIKVGFDTSVNDYTTKRKQILLAMSDYFWHNTFDKDYIGPNNPGVVGVSYEKMYGEFELYCIFQSNVWSVNHDEKITSIDHKKDYYIAFSINGENLLPISERLDSAYSSHIMCINEISYYLAVRDDPFQYYAIANVFESEQPAVIIHPKNQTITLKNTHFDL